MRSKDIRLSSSLAFIKLTKAINDNNKKEVTVVMRSSSLWASSTFFKIRPEQYSTTHEFLFLVSCNIFNCGLSTGENNE